MRYFFLSLAIFAGLVTSTPATSKKAIKLLKTIETVDGKGSGLDADTVQGLAPAQLGGGAPVTFFGRADCPTGFTLIYGGFVLLWNAYSPSLAADGICWAQLPAALPTDVNGYAPQYAIAGLCTVCSR